MITPFKAIFRISCREGACITDPAKADADIGCMACQNALGEICDLEDRPIFSTVKPEEVSSDKKTQKKANKKEE
jgi:hypothetical protein